MAIIRKHKDPIKSLFIGITLSRTTSFVSRYDPKLRAKIRRHASIYGIRSAAHCLAKICGKCPSNSTLQSIMKDYIMRLKRTKSGEEIESFPEKDHGSPVLI